MASFIRRVVVVIAAVVALSSCGDDEPLPAVHYLLCAGIHQVGGDGWIAIIDCDTDSLVDSLGYPGMLGMLLVTGSSDGNFIASRESNRPTRIWDMRSMSRIAAIGSGEPVFMPSLAIYVAARIDSLLIYSLPDFVVDTSIGLRMRHPTRMPGTTRIAAVRERGPLDQLGDLSQVVILDLSDRQLVDSFSIVGQGSAQPLQIADIATSSNGGNFYAIGRAPAAQPIVACLEVASGTLSFQSDVTAATGKCKLSPDGKELWVSDPGYPPIFHDPIWPGQLLVLDARTGTVLDTIPTLGLDANPSTRWEVDDIQFVPGMNKAYVNCRPYYGQSRPILVIDTKTKEVTGMIFGDSGRSAFSIAVVPRY